MQRLGYFVLFIGACSPDLRVPLGSQIGCTSSEECPPGYECRTALGQCAKAGGDDALPAIAEVTMLAPQLATTGTEITVAFSSTKPLGVDPVLRLATPEPAPFQKRSGDGTHFVYGYTVEAGRTAGAWSVLATLVDSNGLVARDLALGTVILDFSGPLVVASSESFVNGAEVGLSALREGSTFGLSFNTSEPLASGASVRVRAKCNGGELALEPVPGATSTLLSYTLRLQAHPEILDGTCTLEAELTDLAGNRVVAPLDASFVIDRTPPPASAVRLDRLRHVRAPWGAALTGGAPRQFLARGGDAFTGDPLRELDEDAFGAEGERLLEARVYGDAEGRLLLGRSLPSAAGWTAVALSFFDARSIWVSVVDAAGNESPRVRVRSGEWLASMGQKLAGSFLENPHIFEESGDFGRRASAASGLAAILRPVANEVSEDAFPLTTQGSGAWQRRASQALRPEVNDGTRLVFDSQRGKVVLFGGRESEEFTSSLNGRIWEFDGNTWTQPQLIGPRARIGHGFVYDTQGGRSIVFGGEVDPDEDCGSGSELCGDMWAWNGTRWQQLASAGPSARADHALAYDERRARMVLFGGRGLGCGAACGDTWEWDGSAWQQRMVQGPSSRSGAAIVYDAELSRVVLFGGSDANGTRGDTWAWDGEAWAQLDGEGPAGLITPSLSYDRARNKLILFGGDFSGTSGRLWEWSGTAWVLVDPGVDSSEGIACDVHPCASVKNAMVYDGLRAKTYTLGGCFGDCDGSYFLKELFAWDGRSWRSSAPGMPASRSASAAAYDSARKRMVLFGGYLGCASGSNGYCQDTWEWDGDRWQSVLATPPAYRADAAIAYSPLLGGVILYGGFRATAAAAQACGDGSNASNARWCTFQDTWSWNGSSWTNLGVGPGRRRMAAAAFDSVGGGVLLYGGVDELFTAQAQTARFNGSWSVLSPATNPGARYEHAMASDWGRGKVVLFGGTKNTELDDETWEWDGSAWTLITIGGPSPRKNHMMSYDADRGRVLLFGGEVDYPDICPGSLSTQCDDAWEYDGISWSKLQIAAAEDGLPPPRADAVLAYDDARQEAVLFGGQSLGVVAPDAWTLARVKRVPAHVMRTTLASIDPGATLTRVDALWSGTSSTAQATRARLYDRSSAVSRLVATYTAANTPALATLDGAELSAQWTLEIRDYAAGGSGTLNGWCLDPNGTQGGPWCRTPALALEDARTTTDTLDLSALGSVAIDSLEVAIDVSHPAMATLSVDLRSAKASSAAALHVWHRGAWQSVATSASGELFWSSTDPRVLSQLALGSRREIHTALTPRMPNGGAPSALTTQSAELRVLYELAPP